MGKRLRSIISEVFFNVLIPVSSSLNAGEHCACADSEGKPHASHRAALSAPGRRAAQTADAASPPLTSPLRGGGWRESKMANLSLLVSPERPLVVWHAVLNFKSQSCGKTRT